MIKRQIIKIINFIKVFGIKKTITLVKYILFPKKSAIYKAFKNNSRLFEWNGLEIWWPSPLFWSKWEFPIYGYAKNIDWCNFSQHTVWEWDISHKKYIWKWKELGKQYICEAEKTNEHIPNKTYDFIISSNCLEHIANPLQAVENRLKILKESWILLIIVPNKQYNFDHKRKDTTFEHILRDYKEHTDEKDLFHLDEILTNHDIRIDAGVQNFDDFKKRSMKNIENRCLHHHVFSTKTMKDIFDFLSITTIIIFSTPTNIVTIGKK